jgi:protein CpxP
MRAIFVAAVLALSASSAVAQTQPTQRTQPTTPTQRTQPTQPNSPCYPSEYGPCSSANQPTGSSVNTPSNSQVGPAFTADQARSRIEGSGYTGVRELQEDVRGNWHGKAVKDGKTVEVTLDYKGSVANATSNGTSGSQSHAFTVDQAKSRIEAEGYSGVTQLKKDNQGNWHGNAVKDGNAVQVNLDFNGNISN